MRREFDLPEADREFLDARGRLWETILNGQRWLLVGNYEVCSGYNHAEVTVALSIESAYPDSQIDMAYFHPALARVDGRAIGALCSDGFGGQTWQRWSRHRTPANPWRPGIDSLAPHFGRVEGWLPRELARG